MSSLPRYECAIDWVVSEYADAPMWFSNVEELIVDVVHVPSYVSNKQGCRPDKQ